MDTSEQRTIETVTHVKRRRRSVEEKRRLCNPAYREFLLPPESADRSGRVSSSTSHRQVWPPDWLQRDWQN